MSKNQTVIYQAPFFEENNLEVTFPLKKNKLSKAYDVKEHMVTYKALVYSLRKYLDKSGFKKVLIDFNYDLISTGHHLDDNIENFD